MRVQRIAQGNFGDVASVGYGIWEMRIHYGPGYRVYYCRIGSDIVLLLCGGDKSSQHNDILRAKRIMAEVKSAKDAGDKEYWR
jgi:putative addiction module killer protein